MQAVERGRDEALHAELVGVPLSVVFASGEQIEKVRREGAGAIVLAAPYHVSSHDAYLVLPEDIGTEIVDIMRDGDLDLLHEAMRDGLLAVGLVERVRKGVVALEVERAETPAGALTAEMAYAAQVSIGAGDVLEALNELAHVECAGASALVDDEGLDEMLRESELVGTSWRAPANGPAELRGAEPTYTWSRRLTDGRVGIELALFAEYDELVALLRPASISP